MMDLNTEQKEELKIARDELGLTAPEMAKAMGAPYPTFKDWQSGRNRLTPMGKRCIELLLSVKGTRAGKQFGV